MPVKVRCPGCEKVLTAPDAARGKAIRCPSCETKVRVPAEQAEATSKKKPVAAAPDSEEALSSLDLRHAEDHEARICGRCGYDMQHMDEEETECPKCGYDSSMGGLGVKAQKKKLKGPDPDKFYASLWKANWKFVFKNQGLAWRTMLYVSIASILMFGTGFLYFYIAPWPPRAFFGLCAFISAMMIPGWLWFMDQEVIVGTLQKKDKLKRINFDFFLCSALGVKFVAWNAVFALPLLLIPLLVAWLMTSFGGLPGWVGGIIAALGYVPVMAMMPICLGHFVMPVQAPGWMFWKVFPCWLRLLKPTFLWLMLTLFLHLPVLGCLGAIGAVYGPQINLTLAQMDENAAISRAKAALENAGKKDKAKFEENPLTKREFHKPNYGIFLIPGAIWFVGCLCLGFPALYSCRVNGQMIYYFRDSMDLVALAKEYKYVAKAKPEEDEEEKPKTVKEMLIGAVVINLICLILGTVGGMVYGAMSAEGNLVGGLLSGAFWGTVFASIIGRLAILGAAFNESTVWGLIVWWLPFGDIVYVVNHWQEGGPGCLISVFSFLGMMLIFILALAGLLSFAALGLGGMGGGGFDDAGIEMQEMEFQDPAAMDPAMMPQPGAMPPGAMPPGAAVPGGAPMPAGAP